MQTYLAEAPPGRVLGFGCLPPNLAMSHGLRDVRGYDSIDPRPLIELLDLVRDARFPLADYARLLTYVPLTRQAASGKIELPPVLNMLGVRYLIFRGAPLAKVPALVTAPDYWAFENTEALPRAFVPRRVERAPATVRLLGLLGAPSFDPRALAYVDRLVSLPADCRGTATVADETPTQVALAVDMATPGLVVLSDLWYEGWHAYRDGEPVPILRTNHALRGVVVPAGRSTIVFRYEPASFARGVQLLLAAVGALAVWLAAAWWLGRRSAGVAPAVAPIDPSAEEADRSAP